MTLHNRFSCLLLTCAALIALSAITKASGIAVGSSSLINGLDYSDTFTVGTTQRPNGLYNDNSGGGYTMQSSHSHPAATWTPISDFSFNAGSASNATPGGNGNNTCCGYSGNTGSPNGGNDAATGVAQTGGGSTNFTYGLRSNYVVQTDAMLNSAAVWGAPPGNLLINSWASATPNAIPPVNSLSVQFSDNSVTLLSPTAGSAVVNTTPFNITDTNWHNFAVDFEHGSNTLGIYVDQALVADVDLATFAGGAFENYSNGAVGIGSNSSYPTVLWFDNFQVGAPVPEPSSVVAFAGLGLLGLARFMFRRRV